MNYPSLSFTTNLRQVFFFLTITTISVNLIDTQIRVCSITESNCCRVSAHLFHNNAMVQISKARPTKVF